MYTRRILQQDMDNKLELPELRDMHEIIRELFASSITFPFIRSLTAFFVDNQCSWVWKKWVLCMNFLSHRGTDYLHTKAKFDQKYECNWYAYYAVS